MRRLLTRILVGAVTVAVIAGLMAPDVEAQQTPISIAKTSDLKFGAVIPSNVTSGKVTISTAGIRTCDPTITCIGVSRGAGFSVSGDPNLVYVITKPGKILADNGVDTIEVDGFEDSNGGSGTLDGTGNDTFTVGAFAIINQNQPQGAYIGTFTYIVEYN